MLYKNTEKSIGKSMSECPCSLVVELVILSDRTGVRFPAGTPDLSVLEWAVRLDWGGFYKPYSTRLVFQLGSIPKRPTRFVSCRYAGLAEWLGTSLPNWIQGFNPPNPLHIAGVIEAVF